MRRVLITFFYIILLTLTFSTVLKAVVYLPPEVVSAGKDVSKFCYGIYRVYEAVLGARGIKLELVGYGDVKADCDIIFCVPKKQNFLEKFKYTRGPLYSVKPIMVSKHENLTEIKKIGIISGSESAEFLKRRTSYELVLFKNLDELMEGVVKGKVDTIFYDSLFVGYFKKELERYGIKPIEEFPSYKSYHFLAYRKDLSQDLQKILEDTTENLVFGDGIRKVIRNLDLFSFVMPANHLVLANIEWPPYEFLKDGEWLGIDADVVKKIFGEIGISIEIKHVNWSRIIHYIKLGIIDGTFSLRETKERKSFFYFSEPISTGIDGLLYKKGEFEVKDVLKGKGFLCGYVESYAYGDILKGLNPVMVPVSDDKTGIKMLVHGRIDAYLVNKLVGFYMLSELGADKSDYGFLPLGDIKYYRVGLSKVDEYHNYILRKFSEKFLEFRSSSSYKTILNRYGLNYWDIWKK